MTELPDRIHPAHLPNFHRHNQPVIVFLTICTKNRNQVLANDRTHALIREAWAMATRWRVGRYMIMPDHVHLFCSPSAQNAENVRDWAAYWKGLVSRATQGVGPLARAGRVAPAPPTEGRNNDNGEKFWLRDCWDTQLRSGDHYAEKWEYVRYNPVRKGLVAIPEEWTYQGELNILWW